MRIVFSLQNIPGTLYFTNPTFNSFMEWLVFIGFYARRAAAINLVLTQFVLFMPDSFAARMISSYSGGEIRVEMNFPRFSFLGSAGLPTLLISLIKYHLNTAAPALSGSTRLFLLLFQSSCFKCDTIILFRQALL